MTHAGAGTGTSVGTSIGTRSRSLRGLSRLLLLSIAFLTLAGMGRNAAAQTWGDPRKITIPQLGEIPVPSPERMVLPNGMVIYLLEHHEFPVVDVRALMRVGSIYESAEKVGLASVTGEVMRSGGTEKISGDDLDRKLESLGASVEIGIGETDGSATVSTLSADLEEGLRILADLLRNPAFPEDKIDLAKKQEKTSIGARNDDPMSIGFREFTKLVYGPDSPYARHTEYSTINAVTRDDVVRFHHDFIHPDRIIMTVYGDFETAKVKKLLTGIFGTWPKSTQPLPADPPINPAVQPGVYLAPKSDATNSIVLIGHVGMKADDPDYPAVAMWNELLGGGFSSRLFNEIRTKRGLAYATGGNPGVGFHHPQALFLYAATQADSTAATTGYVMNEVQKALTEPATQEELDRARDSILNSLVLTLSSKGAVLNRMAFYDFYGYPKDFLTTYQESIRKLTPQDVLAAGQRKVHPAQFATFVVGNKDRVASGLATLGEVREVDIKIPDEAADALPAATDEDFQRGQDWLAAAVQAHGGEAIQSLKDFTYEEKGSFTVQGNEFPVTSKNYRKMPSCDRSEQTLPFGTIIQVVCGDKGWMKGPQGIQEMAAEQIGQVAATQKRDLLNVLTEGKSLKLQALPEAGDVGGKPAWVAFVHDDAVEGWRIFFDKESHQIVRMEYKDRNPATGAPGVAQENLADFRAVGGVQWPHERTMLFDGEPLATLKVTVAAANTGVDDSIFTMPAQ